jgi:hypothetical protein
MSQTEIETYIIIKQVRVSFPKNKTDSLPSSPETKKRRGLPVKRVLSSSVLSRKQKSYNSSSINSSQESASIIISETDSAAIVCPLKIFGNENEHGIVTNNETPNKNDLDDTVGIKDYSPYDTMRVYGDIDNEDMQGTFRIRDINSYDTVRVHGDVDNEDMQGTVKIKDDNPFDSLNYGTMKINDESDGKSISKSNEEDTRKVRKDEQEKSFFYYRDPEDWEVSIIALEKGEWTSAMNADAFRKYKRDRCSVFNVFQDVDSPSNVPVRQDNRDRRQYNFKRQISAVDVNRTTDDLKPRMRRKSKSLTSMAPEFTNTVPTERSKKKLQNRRQQQKKNSPERPKPVHSESAYDLRDLKSSKRSINDSKKVRSRKYSRY